MSFFSWNASKCVVSTNNQEWKIRSVIMNFNSDCISEWIYTLYFSECQGTAWSKQACIESADSLWNTRMSHDNNIQSNASYIEVLTTQFNYSANLAKWLSVHLQTECLWVQNPLLSILTVLNRIAVNESSFYPYSIIVNKCSGSCNDIDNLLNHVFLMSLETSISKYII